MGREHQELHMFITSLLPSTCSVHLTAVTVEAEYVLLRLTTTASAVDCPRCAMPSSTVHSRYQRELTDLPWGRHSVRLQLTVRKFVCRHPCCQRRIFTERVPALATAYARRIQRLATVLQAIGVALGRQAHASRSA
jgi:transposase